MSLARKTGLVLVLAACLLPASAAHAGIYQVYECRGPTQPAAPDAVFSRTDSSFLASDNQCPASADFISVRTSTSQSESDSTYGLWRFHAPAGAGILSGSSVAAAIDEGAGLRGSVYSVALDGTTQPTNNGGGGDTGGSYKTFMVQSPRQPYRSLDVKLRCNAPSGQSHCTAGSSIHFRSVLLVLSDTSPPEMGPVTGPFDGNYHSGPQDIGFTAHDDGGGIKKAEILVNGAIAPTKDYSDCAIAGGYGTKATPCPADRTDSVTILPSALHDGPNSVQLCVSDFANSTDAPNRTCSDEQTLLYDDRAPANPRNLSVVGGNDWRTTNSFDLRWDVEDDGAGSPVTAAVYRITGPSGYDSGRVQVEGSPADHLDDITVPGPGLYTAKVWLRDATGNESEENSESVPLRFDDTRPPDSTPVIANGWIAHDEFPYLQRWAPVLSSTTPSGIKGYAVAIDESPTTDPCIASDRCSEAETNHKPNTNNSTTIANLAEGSHWVHVVAVSGAGLKSTAVRHAELRVDKTDPQSTLSGAPTDWTNQSVALTVYATDTLSGMDAHPEADEGQPLTGIRVDAGSPQVAPSPNPVTAGLSTEGDHLVRFWARDLAGNTNDGELQNGIRHNPPSTAHIRIDKTSPSVAFANGQDPADVEVIRAPVSDALSGVSAGVIGFRPAGSSDAYTDLPTDVSGDELRARFPSDTEADGSYEFKATATDAAGNSASTGSRQNGSPMVLTNPIKVPTHLTATWRTPAGPVCHRRRGHNRAQRRRYRRVYERCLRARRLATHRAAVGYGRTANLAGVLSNTDGDGLRGQEVEVIEEFDPGSTVVDRTHVIQTDEFGRYAATLAAGPSRSVVVRFGGTSAYAAASGPGLRELVSSKLSFTASPSKLLNGQAVVFSGVVAHSQAMIPSGGKLVAIQYRDPQRRKWRPVEVVRSSPSGAFRLRYRFRTITFAQRIRFRAMAMSEAGWPFFAAGSAVRRITVYP